MSTMILDKLRTRPPALLTVPFRPLFPLAALLAMIGVPLWLLVRVGAVAAEGHLAGSLWHGHEMVFGFAVAVFAGFLLTAAQNWTGRTTVRGAGLAALALLWLVARVMLLLPGASGPWPGIVVDTLFLPVTAVLLLRPIVLAGNRRNLAFPIGLLVMGGLNLAMHLAALGRLDMDPSRLLWITLDLMALMMVIMGGRVIPFFSRNALPHAGIGMWNYVDIAAITGAAAIVAADVIVGDGHILGCVALLAGIASLARMLPWRGWVTRRQPILWILHLAYLWLPAAFLLRATAAAGWVPADAALHALGAGAIGALTMGMMSRVALGHSGRALVAAPLTVLAYVLVLAAGVLRVAATFDGEALLDLSAAAWILAWGCFLIVYLPICVGYGASGKPG
jgi:uncharacterized protein involved in response to NO